MLLPLLVLFGALSLSSAQFPPDSRANELVNTFKGRFVEAVKEQNLTAIGAMLSDSFEHRDCGKIVRKADMINLLAALPKNFQYTLSLQGSRFISTDTIAFQAYLPMDFGAHVHDNVKIQVLKQDVLGFQILSVDNMHC